MRNADRRTRLVDVLAARAAGTEGIHADFVGIDLEVSRLVVKDRSHIQRGKRRVPSSAAVKGRDANEPVYALFRLEVAIGVLAIHLEGDGLHARLVAIQHVQLAHGPATAFAIAHIHAIQHLRPVLRLRAARARVQRENGVYGVIRAFEHLLHAHGLDGLANRGGLRLDLVHETVVQLLFRHLDERAEVVIARLELVIALQLVLKLP